MPQMALLYRTVYHGVRMLQDVSFLKRCDPKLAENVAFDSCTSALTDTCLHALYLSAFSVPLDMSVASPVMFTPLNCISV